MKHIKQGSWSIACVCMVLGFMLAVQFRTTEDMKASISYQRVEDLSERLVQTEKERDALKKELEETKESEGDSVGNDIRIRAGIVPLEGQGILVRMDDSTQKSKAGENQNLYVIHDDDILKVVNELRAAGAEAISINGQRLLATSEIRCAGPTLSVNNVRSSAPFEISAIGDAKSLENALKMRGGVMETLKVWGIQMDIKISDSVYIPAYKGSLKQEYAHEAEERTDAK